MRVALTGTPGTGKTSVSRALEAPARVVHLNEVIRTEGFVTGTDEDRDTAVVDMDAVAAWLGQTAAAQPADRSVLVESHLAHLFPADAVVVLRCHPATLTDRLTRRAADSTTGPGTPHGHRSVHENAEAEALDLVLSEAVTEHGAQNVHEIETTEQPIQAVATAVDAIVRGDRSTAIGTVDYTGWLT